MSCAGSTLIADHVDVARCEIVEAPRIVCTCAGQVSRQVEYTNAKTTVPCRSERSSTVLPSWSLSAKSGTVWPGGRSAPAQPFGRSQRHRR